MIQCMWKFNLEDRPRSDGPRGTFNSRQYMKTRSNFVSLGTLKEWISAFVLLDVEELNVARSVGRGN